MNPNIHTFQPITSLHPNGDCITRQAHLAAGPANLIVYTVPANKVFLPTYYTLSVHGTASDYAHLEIWDISPAVRDYIAIIDIYPRLAGHLADNILDQLWMVAGETIRLYSNNLNIECACTIRGCTYDV